MQILIDTDNMPREELAAAINMLDDILTLRRKPSPAAENTEARDNVQRVIDSLGTPEALPHVGASRGMEAPPPPPAVPAPPASIADVVGDDDPEVEIDDEGTVTALTTSVQLPAAPPPPPAAPPAPVAAVPSAGIPAAAPVPPGPAVAAELDSKGYPWDGRIHASNRAKKIDGSWKNKRGVDTNLVVACEAQNKPGNATPGASTTAPPAPLTVLAAVLPATPSLPAAALPASAAPLPPPSMVGSAVPAAVAPAAIDFRGLMQKIQAGTSAGKLSTDQVNAALAGVGLKPEEMAQLIGNTLYIASINAAIDSCLPS